jgi:predicted Zn-dependent peptidase
VVISAAGNLHPDRLAARVAGAFGALTNGAPHRPVTTPSARAELVMREKKELEQLHLCIGVPAFRQSHPDRYCGYVLNTVLGGTMSSRLFQNIREERGLAYTVFSSINSFADTGFLAVYAATRPEGAAEVVQLICGELARLKDAPLDEAELRGAKDHLKGSLMLSLESSSSRMSNLARQEIYFDRQFSLDEIVSGIDAVTGEAVQALARSVLDGRACTAAVLGRVQDLKLDEASISF